jgi:hypothetical protein
MNIEIIKDIKRESRILVCFQKHNKPLINYSRAVIITLPAILGPLQMKKARTPQLFDVHAIITPTME